MAGGMCPRKAKHNNKKIQIRKVLLLFDKLDGSIEIWVSLKIKYETYEKRIVK